MLSEILQDTSSWYLPPLPSHLGSHCRRRKRTMEQTVALNAYLQVITESQNTYGSFGLVLSPLMPPAVGELPDKRPKKRFQTKGKKQPPQINLWESFKLPQKPVFKISSVKLLPLKTTCVPLVPFIVRHHSTATCTKPQKSVVQGTWAGILLAQKWLIAGFGFRVLCDLLPSPAFSDLQRQKRRWF